MYHLHRVPPHHPSVPSRSTHVHQLYLVSLHRRSYPTRDSPAISLYIPSNARLALSIPLRPYLSSPTPSRSPSPPYSALPFRKRARKLDSRRYDIRAAPLTPRKRTGIRGASGVRQGEMGGSDRWPRGIYARPVPCFGERMSGMGVLCREGAGGFVAPDELGEE